MGKGVQAPHKEVEIKKPKYVNRGKRYYVKRKKSNDNTKYECFQLGKSRHLMATKRGAQPD